MRESIRAGMLVALLGLLLASCASSRYGAHSALVPGKFVKDNNPSIWVEDHPRVMAFVRHYRSTPTVKKALTRARSYMPRIVAEFRRRRLPLQLAYLPMLESMFDPRADSGHARGLWQFIPQTAKEMGLRVSRFRDDRLNVRKATIAAAKYLDRLGKKFNYNWALALAAYNGGPGHVENAMRRQHTWNFWRLRLRRETAEYVPRFLAMLRVAQERYPGMIVAELRNPGKLRGKRRLARYRR